MAKEFIETLAVIFLRNFINRDQCTTKGSGLWNKKRPLVVVGENTTITDFKDDSEFVTFLKGQTSFEDFRKIINQSKEILRHETSNNTKLNEQQGDSAILSQ